MKKKLSKISYGKNVYDNKEINAVIKTLKKTTQMGESVSAFEKKVSKLLSSSNTSPLPTNKETKQLLAPSPVVTAIENLSDENHQFRFPDKLRQVLNR